MLASKFHEVFGETADFWGQHPDYPLEDWQYEVANGDTRLGYWDWVLCRKEEADDDKHSELVERLIEDDISHILQGGEVKKVVGRLRMALRFGVKGYKERTLEELCELADERNLKDGEED